MPAGSDEGSWWCCCSEAIDSLVRWYCREAGVRNLEKHIEKVCRKLALEVIHRTEGDEQMQNRDDWCVLLLPMSRSPSKHFPASSPR